METSFISATPFTCRFRFRILERASASLLRRWSPSPTPLCCFAADPQSVNTNRKMLIMGMGFVGQFFAHHLEQDGWEVSGTCTSAIKKKKLEAMGFDVHVFSSDDHDLDLRSILALGYATHMLVSVPPVAGLGDPVLYQHRHLLQSRLSRGNLQWLCYLSSTSVYGDCGGAWVNEDYPLNTLTESAKARLAAEEGWLDLGRSLGFSVQVMRLGGIYGPGRSALDTIVKQESLSPGQRMRETRQYTSRVHVADICQALQASINMPSSGKIYNIVDDDPTPRVEVFAFARTLVQKKWPDQIKRDPLLGDAESLIQKKITRGEKRVRNDRMKNELGVSLLHPTYKSGLQSIIESMDCPIESMNA
ncbi:protein YeeZ isoform X2 [Telopea speciosissima]|uniref:protein YeeZ isoform X2 n=1 Tax=Telopea speciosissima TaxID=54955 RepID=UPI001CC3500C|nr:protein YeeZ isoform X2 [Telopea speciosissima]